MIRNQLLYQLVALTVLSSAVSGQEPPTVRWKGTLHAATALLRLEIDIHSLEGALSGELRSPDQGDTKVPLQSITSDESSLSFSIPGIGAEFKGKVAASGKRCEGIFSQSGKDLPLTLVRAPEGAEPQPEAMAPDDFVFREAWVGKLQLGIMEPVMQFRVGTAKSGEPAARFDSITEGRTGFEGTSSISEGTISFEIPAIKLTYSGKLNTAGDSAEGIWSQGGRDVPLTLKRQPVEYSSEHVWENRPQRPVGPFPYDAEEVTFDNSADALALAGTLTIPKGPGRHPVVVLISGSGPQDRDESLMEHKPFLVLADYLTRRGIAVLRYDDRGFGKSTGAFEDSTTEAFARDASAAVGFLATHPRIDPEQIGLAGHSEGGLVAPMVVGLRDDVAFVVLLAATGVPGAEITRSQTEAMLRAAGVPEADLAFALTLNRKFVDVAVNAAPGEDLTELIHAALEKAIQTLPEAAREVAGKNLRAGIENEVDRLKSDWMQFFLKYDPRPALADIKCPVLAIIGSKDTQVLPDLNMPEIRKALTTGGNQDFETVVVEGLNHLFQKCETGAMGEYFTIQETWNPDSLKIIGDWITGHTKPVK